MQDYCILGSTMSFNFLFLLHLHHFRVHVYTYIFTNEFHLTFRVEGVIWEFFKVILLQKDIWYIEIEGSVKTREMNNVEWDPDS